ncbi:MAG: tail fiber domain-containing protein [Saprospiraceae bacterium]|nr:tail fiber domain-containing protein [Saprospiraceae bacterium]
MKTTHSWVEAPEKPMGYYAGEHNSDGAFNTFIGAQAGEDNTTGKYGTFIGYQAGRLNIGGLHNTAIGYQSGYYNLFGDYNTTLGLQANYRNLGSRNTILGYQAGHGGVSTYSGYGNVMIGYQAGYNANASYKLYIDNSDTPYPLIYGEFDNNELVINGDLTIDVPPGSSENRSEIKFGYENNVEFTIDYDGSNDKFEVRQGVDQITIWKDYKMGINRTPTTNDLEVNGTASKTSAGDWIANSDARLKKNIKALNSSMILSKLLQLKGITYEWDDRRTGYSRPEGEQYGFTAQNVQEVFPELVSEDKEGYLQTAYGTYDALYIEAIRELVTKINILENRISTLESKLTND